MTGTYQDNYSDSLSGEGREICIADEVVSYYYTLEAEDTIDDALASFAASYDHNGATGNVNIHVGEYLNGELVNSFRTAI